MRGGAFANAVTSAWVEPARQYLVTHVGGPARWRPRESARVGLALRGASGMHEDSLQLLLSTVSSAGLSHAAGSMHTHPRKGDRQAGDDEVVPDQACRL